MAKRASARRLREKVASHYYSITRLKTEGKIFRKNKEIPVQGLSWMDHEFGSSQLRDDQVGWDWFSIQLENRLELMFYQIRHRDGKVDPYSERNHYLSRRNLSAPCSERVSDRSPGSMEEFEERRYLPFRVEDQSP